MIGAVDRPGERKGLGLKIIYAEPVLLKRVFIIPQRVVVDGNKDVRPCRPGLPRTVVERDVLVSLTDHDDRGPIRLQFFFQNFRDGDVNILFRHPRHADRPRIQGMARVHGDRQALQGTARVGQWRRPPKLQNERISLVTRVVPPCADFIRFNGQPENLRCILGPGDPADPGHLLLQMDPIGVRVGLEEPYLDSAHVLVGLHFERGLLRYRQADVAVLPVRLNGRRTSHRLGRRGRGRQVLDLVPRDPKLPVAHQPDAHLVAAEPRRAKADAGRRKHHVAGGVFGPQPRTGFKDGDFR